MIGRMVAALAVGVSLLGLAACGGGPVSDHVARVGIAPQEQAYSYFGTKRRDISYIGRRDYKEAMVADCERQYLQGCSVHGRGWFVRWSPGPSYVSIPDPGEGKSTYDEEDVIRRAVAIVNRSLPASKRLAITYTDQTFAGTAIGTTVSYSDQQRVRLGEIHAEIWPYFRDSAGIGWTNGNKGFAFVHESVMAADPEYAVQTMVHEIMHALGLMGHPHHTHTSVLSYQHQSTVVFDNVPLVDMAVLYDMNGWGYWSGNIKTVMDTADGVQFGVHDLEYGTVLIPWVDAGFMPLPHEDALRGKATWTGSLVGKTTGFAQDVYGVAELGVDFDNNFDAWANFHTIRRWNGTMWNRRGWSYNLYVNDYYFDSDDRDGIPDVVGAFYGAGAEVAAGTLQRPEITAAFGAKKN